MGERRRDALRVDFDRSIKLEFHGSSVSSDGALLAYRQLDEALALTAMADEVLTDFRTGSNLQHSVTALLVKLIKTGAKVVRHARYVIFQMAEVAVPQKVSAAILARIRRFATISPKPAPI